MEHQSCLYCGGDASQPDHLKYCDGRQGGREPFDPTAALRFNGDDYVPPRDDPRLTRQYFRIFALMRDQVWRSLEIISGVTGDPSWIRDRSLRGTVGLNVPEPIAQSPDAPVTIHGSYDDADLPRLIAAEHADVLFFPAQWPETYSYTLSAALGTDLPIVDEAHVLLITEKDWVKISHLATARDGLPILRLELELHFRGDDEEKLLALILSSIATPAASPAPAPTDAAEAS